MNPLPSLADCMSFGIRLMGETKTHLCLFTPPPTHTHPRPRALPACPFVCPVSQLHCKKRWHLKRSICGGVDIKSAATLRLTPYERWGWMRAFKASLVSQGISGISEETDRERLRCTGKQYADGWSGTWLGFTSHLQCFGLRVLSAAAMCRTLRGFSCFAAAVLPRLYLCKWIWLLKE